VPAVVAFAVAFFFAAFFFAAFLVATCAMLSPACSLTVNPRFDTSGSFGRLVTNHRTLNVASNIDCNHAKTFTGRTDSWKQ
jgi:hypothetical protein